MDSNGPEERVVSVELKAGTAPELAGAAHVEVAHVAWLSDPVRSAADAVDAIASFERSPALLRVGRKMWELGCPYIHELRSISARCSADDVARLAQLSFGEAIADGSDLVPALPAPALCASGVPDGAASPSALLGRGRICGCSTDLGPAYGATTTK